MFLPVALPRGVGGKEDVSNFSYYQHREKKGVKGGMKKKKEGMVFNAPTSHPCQPTPRPPPAPQKS